MMIQRKTPDSNNLNNVMKQLPENIWKFRLMHLLMMVCVLFLLNISAVNADMVFDFQKKMADKGNTEAQFKVGEMYEMGRGVRKNMAVAIEWFNKASAKGHVEAGYKLLYLDIQKNNLTAENKGEFENLKSKGKSGEGYAQYMLGLMYQNGVGLKKSESKAMEWYKKAALQGITAAEQGFESIETAKRKRAASNEKKQAAAKKKEQKKKNAELVKKKKLELEKEAKANAEKDKAKKLAAEAAKKAAKKAEAKKKSIVANAKDKELKRQALIKARADREKQAQQIKIRKAEEEEFEADPCSGKSARFLSTCR